jgi:hypothetical protein
VRGNIEYAERRPAARNAPIVVEIARRLEIEVLDRPVRNLSGAQPGGMARTCLGRCWTAVRRARRAAAAGL